MENHNINSLIPFNKKQLLFYFLAIIFVFFAITLYELICQPNFWVYNKKVVIWLNLISVTLISVTFHWVYKAKILLLHIRKFVNEGVIPNSNISGWTMMSNVYKTIGLIFRIFLFISFVFLCYNFFKLLMSDVETGNSILFYKYAEGLFWFNTMFLIVISFIMMDISDLILKTHFSFDFIYSDIHANTSPLSSFFISGMMVSLIWLMHTLIICISTIGITVFNSIYYTFFSLVCTLTPLSILIEPYRSVKYSFFRQKMILLNKCKQKRDIESLCLYDKIISKKFMTTLDYFLLSFKLLILPIIIDFFHQLLFKSSILNRFVTLIDNMLL